MRKIFKEGYRVFDVNNICKSLNSNGWGYVREITKGVYPVKVQFDDGGWVDYTYDGKWLNTHVVATLSFTEYSIYVGGFSQKRPEPKLEVGKSYRSILGDVVIINRTECGVGCYGLKYGEWESSLGCVDPSLWKEIPESDAIALLEKECVKWGGEDWRNVNIKECLYHGKTNIVGTVADIGIDEIWNNNGCIFRDGKWAEKLEEPEVKEGQMVWFKDDISKYWAFRPFSRINRGNAFSMTKTGVHDVKWDQYSIFNPYPESIEARAIELLRQFKGVSNLGQQFDQIDEFLKEIDSYEMD